ncbi:hypothetical protein HDV02_000145 [Globomyces sp. JEL0801]|nr:hypothetical protein HDV02_000145 [Globomyces sp. JEL0801]
MSENHISIEDTSPLLDDLPILNHRDSEDDELIDDDEIKIRIVRTVPKGTILSSCINLCNTILGSGMLAMPSALAATGMGLGILLIAFCASCSAFGLFLLSQIAAQVGRKSSFFTCASITYPKAALFFDLAIAIKCFGVSISYLVIVGGLMPQIVAAFYPETALDSLWRSRDMWITACMFIIAPFAFLRRLDSLRYTSAVALMAVVYLLLVVVSFYFFPSQDMPEPPTFGEIEWLKFDSNFLSHFPIFVFAIFSVHNELEDNSSRQINKVISRSIGTSFVVYETIGVIGYLTFGSNVLSNVIAQYPASGIITGGQCAIAFLVLFSYPLQCHPCRICLDKVLPYGNPHDPNISTSRFTVITLGIMVSSYICAVTISDLSTILSLVGATGSTTICYILPGIFYYKLVETQRQLNERRPFLQILAMSMVVFGFVVMFTCLGNIFFGSGAAGH